MATTQRDVIKKFMSALDTTNLSGAAALNAAVKACSKFESMQALINQMVNDCKTAGSADNFLKNYCGIILDNEDTGAVTGSDMGGSAAKNAEDIVPESGAPSYPSGTSFTKGGLTVIIPAKSTLTKDQQTVVQGLYSWWIEESLNLIEESYGYSFKNSDATVKTITLQFENNPSSSTLAYVNTKFSSTNGSPYRASNLTLTVNMGRFNNLLASDVNGKGSNAGNYYLDRTIAHELTHAIMMAKIDNANKLPQFIKEGLAELTHGIDDEREYLIKELAKNSSDLNAALNVNNTGTGEEAAYAAGYMLMHYLAKQAAGSEDLIEKGLKIVNIVSDKILAGSSGNDTISNTGKNVTIQSGAGSDSISNRADYVTINAGDGDDNIYNEYSGGGDYVSINAGAGNDSIYNEGAWEVTIDGGVGNDLLKINYGNRSSINGGTGNDSIFIYGTTENATVKGGADNDVVSIDGGIGFFGNVYQYALGDGDDSIYGFGPNDTLHITSGTYTTQKYKTDLIVKVGSGSITLKNILANNYCRVNIKDATGKLTTINDWKVMSGTSLNDSLVNVVVGVSVAGLAGNDTIENYGDYVSISGGDGKDTIYNENSNVTIDGGEGNDSIYSYASYNSINGGAGDDKIILDSYGSGNTVSGGTGNDTVSLGGYTSYGRVYQYTQGDGNDLVYGFSAKDTLKLAASSYSTTKSGSNLIFNVGSEKITLNGAANIAVKVDWETIPSPGQTINNTISNTLISTGAGNDSILNRADYVTINAGDGDDTIRLYYDSTLGGDYVSVNAGAGNDSIYNNGAFDLTIDGGEGNDSIYSHGANNSINGGAGDDKITLYSVSAGNTVSGGAGNDTVRLGGNANYGHVYQYAQGDGNDVIVGYRTKDSLQISGTYQATRADSDTKDVIISVGNGSISLIDVASNTLNINGNVVKVSVGSGKSGDWTTTTGTAKADKINNTNSKVVIDALGGNDNVTNTGAEVSINGGAGNDIISLSGSAENVTVYGGAGNDVIYGDDAAHVYQYKDGDGKDIINGINENDTIQILSGNITGSNLNGANFVINIGKGSITLKDVEKGTTFTTVDAAGNSGTVKIPEVVFTAKADNYTNEKDEVNLDALAGNDAIENYGLNVTLDGNKGNDYFYNVGEGAVILGGDGKDTIENFAADVAIDGGKDSDYIYIDGDNVTVDGGLGNDTIENFGSGNLFKYANGGGKDVIVGFGEEDSLQITAGTVKSTSAKGTNVILNVGGGSITLEDAAGKEINLIDGGGNAKTTIFGGIIDGTKSADKIESDRNLMTIRAAAGNDTIKNTGFSVTIDGGAGSDRIYNEGADSAIFGGAGNDIIENSGANVLIDGGIGHDKILVDSEVTVKGGKGNDTITASGDNILFQYANGDGKDVIEGFSANDTIQISAGSVKNTVESGNDVIIGIGAGSITLKDYAGNELTIDNNIITGKSQLADIIEVTADNYSVCEIKTAESLAQEKIYIAYSDKK